MSDGEIRGSNVSTWMSKVFFMAVSFAGQKRSRPGLKNKKAAGGIAACGFG
jgi:hypothetical protein